MRQLWVETILITILLGIVLIVIVACGKSSKSYSPEPSLTIPPISAFPSPPLLDPICGNGLIDLSGTCRYNPTTIGAFEAIE